MTKAKLYAWRVILSGDYSPITGNKTIEEAVDKLYAQEGWRSASRYVEVWEPFEGKCIDELIQIASNLADDFERYHSEMMKEVTNG
jgi:hypothetical protein